ncbi:MAG: DUF4355 domain-containing protein [Dorea sp.]|nr:DUF4355 domain-containing protein [Dorea sp.]
MCSRKMRILMSRAQKRCGIPYSGLQLFAEDGDGGGADGDGSGGDDDDDDDDGGGGGSGNGGEGGAVSFDDFLGQEGNQTEFDKRVQAAVDAAVKREREAWEAAADDKVSEAEKLAKMTKEEREKYLQQKERRAFEAEKAAFEREKLLVEVRKELQEQTLPLVFAESLVTIADAKKIKDAIVDIKKAWDAKISEAVKAKARQSTPQEGGHVMDSRRGLSSIRKMANENRIIKN